MRRFPLQNQNGASLIIIVLMIVVIGIIGAALVSLINTETFMAMNQSAGLLTFGIAEGGAEFAQRALALDLTWYRSTVDPILIPATNLGAGAFDVNINLPATMLRNQMTTGAATMTVYTTSRFPVSGFLQIEDDITGGGEFVRYTGISGNTFTGISRGWPIGTVSNIASEHLRGDRVYPVTTLTDPLTTLGDPCAPASAVNFRIASHPKFLTAGTIDIEGEEIRYTGSTTTGGAMTLTGVTRCVNLFSSAHPAGNPVTPILVDSTSGLGLEAELISTGTVNLAVAGNAARVVRKTIQR